MCQSLTLGDQLPGEPSTIAEEILGLGADIRSAKLAVAGDASKEASDFYKKNNNTISLKKKNQTARVNPRAGCLLNFVSQEGQQGDHLGDDESDNLADGGDAVDKPVVVALTQQGEDGDHHGGDGIDVALAVVIWSAPLEIDKIVHVGGEAIARAVGETIAGVVGDELEVACEEGGTSLRSHGH